MSNPTTVTIAGTTFDYQGLFSLSGGELVKVYNTAAKAAGAEPTKRFSDKLSAVKRTWAVLSTVAAAEGAGATPLSDTKVATIEKVLVPEAERDVLIVKPAKLPDLGAAIQKSLPAAKPAKVAKAKKEPKPRGKRFVFPKGSELKEVREGTMRATLVKLLTRENGATFEQCLAATWGTKTDMDAETQEKTCYEAMRLLHYYCGYGMRHLDDKPSPHVQIYF